MMRILFFIFVIFSQIYSLKTPVTAMEKNDEVLITDMANGVRTSVTFNPLRQPVHLTQTSSKGIKLAESNYRYDPFGNVIVAKHQRLMDGESRGEFVIRKAYDDDNRLLWIAEGAGDSSKIVQYHYHSNGKLEKVIKANGIFIDYSYDQQGMLIELKASDGSLAYTFAYDNAGHLSAIHDLCLETVQTRKYDEAGHLVEELQSSGVKVAYRYDALGRQTGFTLPDGSQVAYHYEEEHLSRIERLEADQTLRYSHGSLHHNGFLTADYLLGAMGEIEYRYDQEKRLVGVRSPWWSQSIPDQGFDWNGRIVAMRMENDGKQMVSSYSYAEDGQLAEEAGHQYAYDSLGNRMRMNDQDWEVNSHNQLIRTAEAEYVYDLNGNLVEKHSEEGTTLYSYDALDRMVRLECRDNIAYTYVYDAFGRRLARQTWKWQKNEDVWKRIDTEKYVYDGFKEIGKIDKSGNLVELRILRDVNRAEIGAAIALELQGRLFLPMHDIQGSIRCLVDAQSGEIVESYTYTAYGEESLWDELGKPLKASRAKNPWRYFSKRSDAVSGLVSFGKRDYDPQTGRWMTPDPLLFSDAPNLYVFARNDPLNCYDLYGLFSVTSMWDNFVSTLYSGFQYLKTSAHVAKMKLGAELQLPSPLNETLEKMAKGLFGETSYLLMGPHFEETDVDSYGEKEISDKVRVTFVNGILNTRQLLKETINTVSQSHGGVKIHYVFRPTEGWTWDISRGLIIKLGFVLGFRSLHAYLLAELWRNLIQEMGGVGNGGTIIHYAHSLGGTETDRARELLTPEEQQMIRVITFGSSTFVRNEGFQSVINHVSVRDGVSSFFLEPLGHIRNFLDPDSNVRFHGSFFGLPIWPADHLLNGVTYDPLIREMGQQFIEEFGT